MQKIALVSLTCLCLLSLGGCVTQLEVVHTKPCFTVVPARLTQPVAGTALPVVDGDGNWFHFGDNQTAQLDKANQRNDDVLNIIKACEVHDRSAIVVKRKGRFFKDFLAKNK
jgi:hypothetical protein